MSITYFYLALVIGLILSLLFEEWTGINAGGSICPGFFAMICDDLPSVFMALCITLLIYLVVEYLLPKFMIIYGRRRFTACLIFAVIFKLFFDCLYPLLPFPVILYRGIGVMSTGVLANNCIKQGLRYTIPACALVTLATYAIINLIAMTGVIA